jgi:hypothetical protein
MLIKDNKCLRLAPCLAALALAPSALAKTDVEVLGAGGPREQGEAVAGELLARNTGYKDLGGQVDMVLRDEGGGESRRSFRLKVLERRTPADGDRSLIAFESPADVRGTAVLSHAAPRGADEQWLYLPASHRTKKVSSSNRTGAFVGSEFSFEDLTGNDIRKYTWTYVDTRPCGAASCFVVDAVPTDPDSAYSKRTVFVDRAEFRVQSIDFFDKRNVKTKTLTYEDYTELDGKFWRARTWTMKNHETRKSTVIRFSSMKIYNGFSENEFSPSALGS